MRPRNIAAIAATLLAMTACKPESARKADRAAKDVVEQREKLVKAAKNAADKPDIVNGTKEVLAEASELAAAAEKFEKVKAERIAALRAQRDVTASQPLMISTMAKNFPITDAARGDVNEKLTRFQSRLDEVTNMIEGLTKVSIDEWETRNSAMTEAMERLEDARKAAWNALEAAPHIDPSSS